jgi:hypothetical protein
MYYCILGEKTKGGSDALKRQKKKKEKQTIRKEQMTHLSCFATRSTPQTHLPPSPSVPMRSTRCGHRKAGMKKSPRERKAHMASFRVLKAGDRLRASKEFGGMVELNRDASIRA